MAYLRIKTWEHFQHYKDRNPIWIKLHRELLTSRTWVTADDASRVLAIACMLLAAETENKIPLDKDYLRRRAFLNQDPDLTKLVASQFIEIIEDDDHASNMLASCYQDASPETETETETEKRQRKEKRSGTNVPSLPDWIPLESWNGFIESRRKLRAPLTNRGTVLVLNKLEQLRAQGHDPAALLDEAVERGWKSVYAKGTNHGNRNQAEQRQTSNIEARNAARAAIMADR
jgi:hypothetical protein